MVALGMDVSNLHVAEFNEDMGRSVTSNYYKWAQTSEDGTIGRIKNIFSEILKITVKVT